MMHWENLLSLRKQGHTTKRIRKEQDETRLDFEVDYDRVIFSSPFRSLQDKTQVIPLSKTDFVHTRLTHSLEVSVVGRSLGRQAGKEILKKHPQLDKSLGYRATDFGAIVAAAALAHDIGNPPFGHSGEKAIGSFYSNGKGKRFKEQLTDKEYQDLVDFEGNANGFKILTQNRPGVTGGLRLTYATLGAFMKYPKESLPKKPTDHIADKKYGVFQENKTFFKEVATDLQLLPRGTQQDLSYCRHPLAYLVEAADDICYTIIDFEDGINLGWIEEDFALEYLINLVRNTIDKQKYASLTNKADRLGYLRSLSINVLITEAVESFITNETAILKGEFSFSLLDKSNFKAQIDDILKISRDNVYQHKEVVDKEIAGFKILNVLLDHYTTAAENNFLGKASHYDELLLKSLPKWFLDSSNTLYDVLLNVTSYLAGLTDGNALLMFKKLNGHLDN